MKIILRSLIEKLEIHQEINENINVYKELHGYHESIPKYRTILGEIIVDGIDGDGNIIKDYELIKPQDFLNDLYFDNFRTFHFYNGL